MKKKYLFLLAVPCSFLIIAFFAITNYMKLSHNKTKYIVSTTILGVLYGIITGFFIIAYFELVSIFDFDTTWQHIAYNPITIMLLLTILSAYPSFLLLRNHHNILEKFKQPMYAKETLEDIPRVRKVKVNVLMYFPLSFALICLWAMHKYIRLNASKKYIIVSFFALFLYLAIANLFLNGYLALVDSLNVSYELSVVLNNGITTMLLVTVLSIYPSFLCLEKHKKILEKFE